MKDGIKKYIKPVFVLLFVAVIIIGGYYIYVNYIKEDRNKYIEVEHYDENEYYDVYVNEDRMAKIYFSNFMNMLMFDVDKAYSMLNKDYKDKKFSSIDSFKIYVNSINFEAAKIKSFATKKKSGYEYFYIYDTSDNLYIFKTKGVMNYEIYFDSDTVEI